MLCHKWVIPKFFIFARGSGSDLALFSSGTIKMILNKTAFDSFTILKIAIP